MAEKRKFWGGMMPVSKIGKDTSGNPIDGAQPERKASPPVPPAHGANKPGTKAKPLQKGTGEDSVE